MARAKVVIDSKFPDAVFYEILGSQWVKMTSLFAPFLRDTKFDRAEIFFTDTRDTLGSLFFFVLKNIVLSIFGRYYKKSCS